MRYVWFSLLFLLTLAGCQVKENYTMQYAISNQLAAAASLAATENGFSLVVPLADFTCDAKSVRAELSRDDELFVITITAEETGQRCDQTFTADVEGATIGTYQLNVVYRRGAGAQTVFTDQVNVRGK